MQKNVGTADRIIRVTFGISFLALGVLKVFGPTWSVLFSILGIEVLVVAALGYSPIYHLLGISSLEPRLTVEEEVANWTTGVPDSEK
ncbi:MAG: YgaP family membrane protein [Bacillota bacterium]